MKNTTTKIWAMILPALMLQSAISYASKSTLLENFQTPPATAKPQIWWHWLDGNISQSGIEKDLAWMHKIGLGGVQNFNASMGTPQIVPKRLDYMSPQWKSAFAEAVASAKAKGMAFTISSSAGWSETGGPWVQPKDGMKKLVWSEETLVGGEAFDGELPKPPSKTGPYQGLRFRDPLAPNDNFHKPTYYQDVAILAYPVSENALPEPKAETGNGQALSASTLLNSDWDNGAELTLEKDKAAPSITYQYTKPFTVRSTTLFIPDALPPFGSPKYAPVLEAKMEGKWIKVADIPLTEVPTTVSFPAVSSDIFRLRIAPPPHTAPSGLGSIAPGAMIVDIFGSHSDKVIVGHWALSAENKIQRAQVKAGYAMAMDYQTLGQTQSDADAISPQSVINLTSKVSSDGKLNWTPPKGSNWRVVRFGYSLLGTTNHPATPEATGLEVDKLDAAAVKRYVDHYLDLYKQTLKTDNLAKAGIGAMVVDSYEAGSANWTGAMIAKFKALRGYDPTPWLPVLTGSLVGSAKQSEAFLNDFRQTLGDLISTEHYKTIAEEAHKAGLKVYGEALENSRPVLGDDMSMRSYTNYPMAALWSFNLKDGAPTVSVGDMRGAASVAHIYGQNIAAAESFTSIFSPWAFAPADLKRVVDFELVNGINRPVIHSYVHQPVDDKVPGLSLAVFGQYFNRNETWASMAKPWISYIARSSYMLQQGQNQADVAYFYGEENPLTALYKTKLLPDVPTHYAYDFVSKDALLNQLHVDHGDLVAKSGVRYKALYLGEGTERLSYPVLQKIASFVEQGATVAGLPPKEINSLDNDQAGFTRLVHQLWPVQTTKQPHVIRSRRIEHVLEDKGIVPDFIFDAPQTSGKVLFAHRKLADGDLYFVTNQGTKAVELSAKFRSNGYAPSIWNAMDASVHSVPYHDTQGQTQIPLTLNAGQAVFVVMTKDSQHLTTHPRKLSQHEMTISPLYGPWQVTFQANRGAPKEITLSQLMPLNQSKEKGIRYFSGVAHYQTTFEVKDNALLKEKALWLDLGKVGDVARTTINGHDAGISWFPPYQVNIAGLLKAGKNTLDIDVADLWVNRLIGDMQPNAKKVTFTAAPTYLPNAPLRTSGLIGPVTLKTMKTTH